MKTAAKVFIIIGVVGGFFTIVAPIFGIMALNQMKTQGRPETWLTVCVLIFCSLIGGILLLVGKPEDFPPDV